MSGRLRNIRTTFHIPSEILIWVSKGSTVAVQTPCSGCDNDSNTFLLFIIFFAWKTCILEYFTDKITNYYLEGTHWGVRWCLDCSNMSGNDYNNERTLQLRRRLYCVYSSRRVSHICYTDWRYMDITENL